ncbi:RHS repeat protein, partial [Escherichia coli]
MSGKPAARQGDMTQYGGSIVQGSAGVRIGAPTGVACSVCPGGVTSGHPVNPLLGAKVLPGETDIALTGLITRITTPDGRASAFYYNHHNQLTSATGPDGL